jgi:ATP-dependent Clp protease ATP-binding subunit ClpA
VYAQEELAKRTFNNKAYEERLKNVLANITEDDNPVLFIYGLK